MKNEFMNLLDCTKEEFLEHYHDVEEYIEGLRNGTHEAFNPKLRIEFKTKELEKLEILYSIRFSEDIKKA